MVSVGWVARPGGCVGGVVGVVGGQESSSAGAGFEGPALVGFEAVVVGAEPVEVAELGDLDRRPVDPVVDLEVAGGGAAEAGARRGVEVIAASEGLVVEVA